MDAERRPIIDDDVGRLASRQGGVVSRAQLTAMGMTRGAVANRIATGRLHHIPGHRGVLAVGHTARTTATALWAAHLALGPASIVSHRSAAALWELQKPPTRAELTVLGGRRRRAAFIVHRTTWLPAHDMTRIDGLPVTSVPRTLLDLGAVAVPRLVERAFDQADVLRILDAAKLERVLLECPSHRGARTLRRIVARDAAGSTVTASYAEELMLAIIRRARLPRPVLQHPILDYRVDFCWPAARLVVEVDGGGAHGTRRARARDVRRDVRLSNAGWTVLRFTYEDVAYDPRYVTEALTTALAIRRRSA